MRDLRAILQRFAPISGIATTPKTAMSRAALGAQTPDMADDSGEGLAALSRMSLGDRTPP
jgi:hypothetical protein